MADCKLSGAIQKLSTDEKKQLLAYVQDIDNNRPLPPPQEVVIKLTPESVEIAEKLTGKEIAKRVQETNQVLEGG